MTPQDTENSNRDLETPIKPVKTSQPFLTQLFLPFFFLLFLPPSFNWKQKKVTIEVSLPSLSARSSHLLTQQSLPKHAHPQKISLITIKSYGFFLSRLLLYLFH